MTQTPPNMTRLLLVIDGIMEFAFYKDGMFRTDSQRHLDIWLRPDEIDGWVDIKEVKFKLDIP